MNTTESIVSPDLLKLQAISATVGEIQFRIEERLPLSRQQLLALICASKWRTLLSASLDMETITKKMRMETHSYDYRVREQAELLERHLCELDSILSNGNIEVKEARKTLVLHIQTLLQRADGLKVAASRLMRFTEAIIATMPRPIQEKKTEETMEQVEETMEEADMKEKNETEIVDEAMESEEQTVEDEKMESEEVEEQNVADEKMVLKAEPKHESDCETEDADEEMESDDGDNQKEVDQVMASEEVQQSPQEEEENDEETHKKVDNEEEEEEEEEEVNEEEREVELEKTESVSQSSTIDTLPIWTPYYHMEQRGDGLYLIAKLHSVHPSNLHVSVQPHSGLITITGVKFPTQKDLILSRWTGTPTFGRFKLVKQVDPTLVNIEEATQRQTADGTLVIRLPFYYLHHPRMFERAMFAPRRHCTVW